METVEIKFNFQAVVIQPQFLLLILIIIILSIVFCFLLLFLNIGGGWPPDYFFVK